MSTYSFTVIIEPDEEGFRAFVPALPGCHSFGATIEEAHANIAEAAELHVESLIEDGAKLIPPDLRPLTSDLCFHV